ncbi:MAG TPA: outer membrane protein [Afipia sp.]
MKKLLLGTVAVLALGSTSVLAADLPARTYTKAPPIVAPVYNWNGFYIGAHVGGAFGGDNGVSGVGISTSNRDSAFLGGGQGGYNWQFAPNWLLGVEGDISGLSSSDRNFNNGPAAFRDRTDWLASVTGRLGYTWGPGLIYAKGGVAFRDDNGLSGTTPFATNRDSTGYTIGGGLEYMFAPAWSAKIEYQYYNFDNTSVVPLAGPAFSYKDDVHTVKAGINYHFNWGNPIAGRY